MWSHYADSHKDFCLGFKGDLWRYFDDHDWPIDHMPVRYSSEHPFIDIHNDLISKKRFNFDDGFLNLCELSQALLDAAITVKHASWHYEEEERIVSEVSGLHSFHAEALDYLILGIYPKNNFMSISFSKSMYHFFCKEEFNHAEKIRRTQSSVSKNIIC